MDEFVVSGFQTPRDESDGLFDPSTGCLTDAGTEVVKKHLLNVGAKICTSCSHADRIRIVSNVLTMRCAQAASTHEVKFVPVMCESCFNTRFFPASEMGL